MICCARLPAVGFALALYLVSPVFAIVEHFDESFSGKGPYGSLEGNHDGFDNPSWSVQPLARGEGEVDVALTPDGLTFSVISRPIQRPAIEFSQLDMGRVVDGFGSFTEQIVVHDVDLSQPSHSPDSFAGFSFWHNLLRASDNRSMSTFKFGIVERPEGELQEGNWHLIAESNRDIKLLEVPRASNIAFGVVYDDQNRKIRFAYDDLDSDAPVSEVTLPFEYDDAEVGDHQVWLSSSAGSIDQFTTGVLAHWTLRGEPDIPGDFNTNDVLDIADIDLLSTESQAETHDTFFDLNNDGLVNDTDRTVWVHDLKKTSFGDANLNGLFDSADLVNVFRAGEYDDDIALNSTWATGDWNGDGDFDSGDLVTAFQDGGYVQGAVAGVPEPSALVLMFAGALVLVRFRS